MRRKTCQLVFFLLIALRFSGAAGATELVPGQVMIDGERFIEDLRRLYQTAETYSHTCTWKQAGEGLDDMPSSFVNKEEQTSVFFFQRPDRASLLTEDRHVIVNDGTVWAHDLRSNRYTESTLNEEIPLAWALATEFPEFDTPVVAAYDYLVERETDSSCVDPSDNERWNPNVTIEVRGGVPGKMVSWESSNKEAHARGGMWVSDINGAIFEWEIHSTGHYWPEGAESGLDPVEYSTTTSIVCDAVEINPALSPQTFMFNPDGEAKKVENLDPVYFDPRPPWDERVAPTISLTDGSLDELDQDHLNSQSSVDLPHFGGHVDVTTTDEDFDGVPDVLIIGYPSTFSVFNGATGDSRSIRLRGRPASGSVRKIIPIPNQGETLWVAQTDHYQIDSSRQRSTCSLHGPKGDEWWVYSPEIPDDRSSRMVVAAGDLDGDGISEVIVGVVVQHQQRTGDRSYTVNTESSMLAVLDIEGNRLIQRSIDSEIFGIEVRGPVSGQTPTILCITGTGVEEFALAP